MSRPDEGGERLWGGAGAGLAAAALFGASTPVAKRLLGEMPVLCLAGLLYAGAAVAMLLAAAARRIAGVRAAATLSRRDAAPLLGIVLLGGVIAPLAMLAGLARVSGFMGSLLLNLEAPFTMVVALALFGEHLGRRSGFGALAIVVGGGLLALGAGVGVGAAGEAGGASQAVGTSSAATATATVPAAGVVGALLLAGACLAWGLENNLSQRMSGRDPLAVVAVKAGGASTAMLLMAAVLGLPWPRGSIVVATLVVGALSYGLSLVLDMRALRLLGAAREAAYFATAPFFGAILAVAWLGDRPSLLHAAAAAAMVAGVVLLRFDRHEHAHTHEALEHEHLHVHDAHHQHDHTGLPGTTMPVHEPHSHRHRHEHLIHSHAHVSDSHHRHGHGRVHSR